MANVQNIFKTASGFIKDVQREHLAEEGTYSRPGSTMSGTIYPTPGDMLPEVDNMDQVFVTQRFVTMHFAVEDLPSGCVEPEPGDRIQIGDDVYELEDVDGVGAWQYTSVYKERYRVYCRRRNV